MMPDEPEHYSWNLGTPDNAVGTEVIVNPYATPKRTVKVSPKQATGKRKVKVNRSAENKVLSPEEMKRQMYKTSMSITEGGRELLIPTVDMKGKALTPREAIQQFKESGTHLGEFDTPEEATAHAVEMMKAN